MTDINASDALRQRAYQILQQDANLSLAECQFYENEVLGWIDAKHTFTAYEISYTVNSQLIQASGARLRHELTREGVHLLISMYAEAAGYRSELVDLGSGRMPRLYYPDEFGRQRWKEAQKRLGKPGRKDNTADIACYANERRPGTPWKDICSSWKSDHPDDSRCEGLNEGKVREAWRRGYGDKRR